MRAKLIMGALTALNVALVAHAAVAANTSVPFTGTVLSTCVLTVGTPGVLAPSADYTELGSKQPGGLSGLVTIVSTGATYNVSADAPSSFSLAPAGGNSNVTFEARYSAFGATSIGSTLGTSNTLLNAGLTTLNVDLKATKSTGVFAQGAYQTAVVVRCE